MKEGLVMRFLRRLERSLYRSAERIVTVTDPMRARLIERGVPEEKVGVVPNGADLRRLLPRLASAELAAELKLEGKFVVGYVGTHGFAQGLEVVVKAAALVSDRNIHFLFVGEGARRDFLVKLAARLQLQNVTFVRGVPSDTAVEYLALCDAIVVPLKNSALFDGALPSKIFEAAAMEKPLLLSAKGLSADVVREYNAGIVAEPENQQALAAAVLRLHDDVALGDGFRVGCRALARKYNRETLANRSTRSASPQRRRLDPVALPRSAVVVADHRDRRRRDGELTENLRDLRQEDHRIERRRVGRHHNG